MNKKIIILSILIFSTIVGNVFAEDEENIEIVESFKICTNKYIPVCAVDKNGEEKTYGNKCTAGENEIIKNSPCLEEKNILVNIKPGQIIESPLKIFGNSNGVWFGHEGELGTVSLVDENNNILAGTFLKIEGEWMTSDPVNFFAELNFDSKDLKSAKLIFNNNNPSGTEGWNKSFEIPVRFMKEFKPCTKEYNPVCGKIDTGVRCITEPCPVFVEKTFPNRCVLENSEAEILHEGQCDISLELEKESEIEFKGEALVRREEMVQEKSIQIFSKFDSFVEELESLILKVTEKLKNYDNEDSSIELLEKINDDLFLAKNKIEEGRSIFSKIPQQENKEEVKKNIEDVKKILGESKKILKDIFINLKEIIINIK